MPSREASSREDPDGDKILERFGHFQSEDVEMSRVNPVTYLRLSAGV